MRNLGEITYKFHQLRKVQKTRYYFSEDQKKAYKLESTESGAKLFWVTVCLFQDGSFHLSRGCDLLDSYDKGLAACEAMADPSTEEKYLNYLKDYFGVDKQVREAFIKKYNL